METSMQQVFRFPEIALLRKAMKSDAVWKQLQLLQLSIEKIVSIYKVGKSERRQKGKTELSLNKQTYAMGPKAWAVLHSRCSTFEAWLR